VNEASKPVPAPSPLYLTALDPSEIPSLLSKWSEILLQSGENVYIKGDNDTFKITNLPDSITPQKSQDVDEALSALSLEEPLAEQSSPDRIVDYDALTKHIIVSPSPPSLRETPNFSIPTFYHHLESFSSTRRYKSAFGRYLIYADVVTSTNTMLEKYVPLRSSWPA